MSTSRAISAKAATAAPVPSRRGEYLRVARLLNRFLAGQRAVFGMAMLMLIMEALTSILNKYPIKWLLDYLTNPNTPIPPIARFGLGDRFSSQTEIVGLLSVAVLVIAVFNSLSDSLAEIYLSKGGRLLGFRVRDGLYSHLQKLSLAFYSKQRTGDLLTRVTGDVTALEDFATKSLKDIAGSVFLIGLTLFFLFREAWQMGLIALVSVPVLSLASNYFAERIKVASKKQRANEGELAAAAQQMLTSIRVIQTYGSAGDEQKRFVEQSRRAMDVALLVGRLQAWFGGVISVLQAIAVVIIVWIGVLLANSNTVTAGSIVLFLGLIQDMFKPTKRIIKQWNEVGKIIASTERIGEVLDRKPAVQDAPNARPAPRFKGYIEFRHVSFAYQADADDAAASDRTPPRLALNDISLSIAPGEVIALVGSSGAGKSTIMQLLPRLYDPHVGQVRIDGHDLREWTLESLRAQMSMVLQDTILFSGSVADNIAYGRAGASRDEVIAAAMQASAHDFIMQMPDGYDTLLSERASNLSGGQRQRLAIARAFIRNTPILLLDEPTTGLDAESTDLVRSALRTLMRGKTTIIISHDLNLIRDADRIVVIKAGTIEQIGSHDMLIKTGGLYAQLYAKQFGATAAAAVNSTPDGDDDDEPEANKMRAFASLLSQALPKPVTQKAFETIALRIDAAPEDGGKHAPASVSATSDVPPRRSSRVPTQNPAIFRMTTLPVLQDTAPQAREPSVPTRHEGRRATGTGPVLDSQPAASPTRTQRATASQTIAMAVPHNFLRRTHFDTSQLDPGRSTLRRELPGLATALNADQMRDHFQQALFGSANGEMLVAGCDIDTATFLDSECCVVHYNLLLTDRSGTTVAQPVVCGRLFAATRSAASYLREQLAPIAEQMRGRPELAFVQHPVAAIDALNMAVSVFPIDGELPTLATAFDAQHMLAVLGRRVPDANSGALHLDRCEAELVDYGREGRCTLRYRLHGHDTNGDPAQLVVYGKLTGDGSGAQVGAVSTALRSRIADLPSEHQVTIPRSYGWQPELKLVLLEALPGQQQIASALKARQRGQRWSEDGMSLEEMIATCGHIAALLHSTNLNVGRRRTAHDELTRIEQSLAHIHRFSPELGSYLQDQLDRANAAAERSDPLPLRFCHGDFTHGQVIFDGMRAGLIDFDSVCQAEPALDLAQFLVYLRLAASKTEHDSGSAPSAVIDALSDRFLGAYYATAGIAPGDVERLRERIALYEVISMLRRVARSWHKFKPFRIERAIPVLEERLAWLP